MWVVMWIVLTYSSIFFKMSQESCSVYLNKSPNGVFYSGDIVIGSVTFVFKKKQKILDIDCRVVGKCEASWTRPMPTIPFIKVYSQKVTVCDIHIDSFDHYKGTTVSPGIESYNFYFTLPDDLPSTFESSLATVQYYFKLTRRFKCKVREKTIVPFIVTGKVNLNHLEEFVTPSFYAIQKSFKFMNGIISISLKTFKGFAPAQIVPFEVGILNEQKIKISKIKVFLIQKIKYTVQAGYANEENKVCKVECKVNSNNEKELCRFTMKIPNILPSSIHISEPTIGISYAFRAEVIFPFHSTCYEDIPVTVATIDVNHYDHDEAEQLFYEI